MGGEFESEVETECRVGGRGTGRSLGGLSLVGAGVWGDELGMRGGLGVGVYVLFG